MSLFLIFIELCVEEQYSTHYREVRFQVNFLGLYNKVVSGRPIFSKLVVLDQSV